MGQCARDRRDADERPAPGPRHDRRGVLEGEERADHVHVDDGPELGDVTQRQWAHVLRAARRGEDGVEAAAGVLGRGSHRRGNRVLVGDVGCDPVQSLVADLGRGRLEPLLTAAGDRHRRRATGQQPSGATETDPAAAAGDQHAVTVERLHRIPFLHRQRREAR